MGRYGIPLTQVQAWYTRVKHMARTMTHTQQHGVQERPTRLDMKNILPTSFTWPEVDEPAALMYVPSELPIRAKATRSTSHLDHNMLCLDETMYSSAQGTPAREPPLFMEATPSCTEGLDRLREPVELPLCSTPPDAFTSLAGVSSHEQPGTRTRLEAVATLRTLEPPVKRTKAPLAIPAKRKCLVDRLIGYSESEWTSRIQSARAQHLTRGSWYHAQRIEWPRRLSDRLGMLTSIRLVPLWQKTVELHVNTLDRHYHALNEHAKEAWIQRRIPPSISQDVKEMSQGKELWPDGEYSSEVGRGQDQQEQINPLPWTSLGQTYLDWPEDVPEQSFSSANLSIVHQAARWQSPRLPRMSSDSLSMKGLAKNTSMGSLPSWPADPDDSTACQAEAFDGTLKH